MKVACLSWHPATTKNIVSGGYRRFYEIAKRTSLNLVIIDRHPTIYEQLKSNKITVLEYFVAKQLSFLKLIHPLLYNLMDRIFSVIGTTEILLKLKPEIVYVPDSELSHLTLPAVFCKLIFKSRVVLANLNVNVIWPERILNKLLHRYADDTITISKKLKQDIEKTGIKIGHVNGVGFEFPKRFMADKSKKFDAIFIGRHIPEKGVFDLIEIWDILLNRHRVNLKLVLIGNTPDIYKLKIKSLINKKSLAQNVFLFGEISESAKWKLLNQAKIMVFPSKQEGWGIAPMEALSQGVPVVAYSLPVYKESIGITKAFRTVKMGDTHEFANTVLDTINNLPVYQKAANEWKPSFDWNTIALKEWNIVCKP